MGDLTIAEQSDKEFVQIEDDNEKPRNWIHTEPDRWESAEHELILR